MKTYIQIGTAYGNDFFYNQVKDLNPDETRLILVEPMQWQSSVAFYQDKPFRSEILKNAVVPNDFKEDFVEMYLFANDLNLSSILNRKAITSSNVVFCPAIKIHDLLDMADGEIEFLSIDAEGLDVELLNSIDYSKYKINNIFFEYWDFDDDANNIYVSKSKFDELDKKLSDGGFNSKEKIDTDGNLNFLYRKV
jgi:hypothetical protein